MAYVTVNGESASYIECTENYEKALETNREIDAVADSVTSYKRIIDDILSNSTQVLSSEGNLLGGISSSIAQINSLISMWEGSYPAMQADNIEEAKLIDEEITASNRQAAINSLSKPKDDSSSSSTD